ILNWSTVLFKMFISWAWERKEYGSTRSFIRRLGNCLLLTPTPRPHFPQSKAKQLIASTESP
uniref:Mitochondrial fission regulator n=1 Tax=Varanus komodoensis TaxID=61221 RepID=A0A8D2JJD5_VARKO